MDNDEICFMSATEMAEKIRTKALSPVEIVNAVIERVETLEPKLNAFATFTPERAIEGAKRAEAQVMSSATLGRLHGVPVTIKDLADTAGIPTQRGSHILKDFVPSEDTAFVTRLAQAGAISLGKTTTSEFGWKGVSESPLTGITSNPWKLGLNAGASSAGAGAGAGAGYGPLHHGSDGAGSIRMPAHFCGIFGLKPTFGRIPNVPVRNNDQASHHGPMTRSVADAALMLEIMAGPHPLDHYSLESPPEAYTQKLRDLHKPLRIAFSPDLGHARVDADVAKVVSDAVDAFAELGLSVEIVTPDFGPAGPDIARFFWAAHELDLEPHLAEFESKMDPGLVACLRSAQEMSAADYLKMRTRKHDYIAQIHSFFTDWDILLTPSVSVPAFPATLLQPAHWPQHEWDWLVWAEFSYPFNMSANPAASVPAGFTDEGLPVGLQIVGRRFDDLGVLQLAHAFESVRPWHQHRPAP